MKRQRDMQGRTSVLARRARLRDKRRGTSDAGERAKAAFLSVVSHELRTPLNTILGQAELLADDGLPPFARHAVEAIRSAGQGLYAILNDVLDLAKLEAGTMPADAAELDVRSLIEGVRRLVQPTAWAQELDLEVSIDRAVPARVSGDAGRIRQTLANLVGNALKFTERGGVSIVVELVSQPCDALKIAVSDTGIGISRAQRARIFEAFEHRGDVLTRRHEGLGLGLALCKRLVGSMGGDIGVESQTGKGSTFWFTAPISRSDLVNDAMDEPERPDHPASTDLARLNGIRILAADDNHLHRETLARLFDGAAIKYDIVGDGLEAVEAAGKTIYDAVLLDAHMPVVNGIQAARMIRALRGRQASSVILIACPVGDHTESDAAAMADAIIRKPYSAQALFGALTKALGGETDEPSKFDSSGIVELEQAVGRPVLVDILKSFLSSASEMVVRIEAAALSDDSAVMEQAARDLAGAASGLGLAALTAAARELSQAARRKDAPIQLKPQAAALIGLTGATHRELVQLYPDLTVPQAA